MKKTFGEFSMFEKVLWMVSTLSIIITFLIFDGKNFLSLLASLVGATSLIFAAKGNPIGPSLMIIFSILYGIISHNFAYYGEMITYLGMTLPMSVIALLSWLKNPYKKGEPEVKVKKIKNIEWFVLSLLTIIITILFYFILRFLNTANLFLSTLSVSTSFLAVYLTFKRSPYYALAYAANDIVLIVLWVLASVTDIHYISVVICFVVFFFNDVYGFINWKRIQKRQI